MFIAMAWGRYTINNNEGNCWNQIRLQRSGLAIHLLARDNIGIESIFELNFCDMLPCGTRMDRVYQAEKYMCVSTRRDGTYMTGYSCEEWSQASWLTHPGYKEGYYPLWSRYKKIQKGISLTRRLYGYKEVWSNNGLAVKGESIFIQLRADLLIPENRSHKTDKGLVFLMLRTDTYGEDLKVVIHLSGVALHPNGVTHEEYCEVKTGELDQNMWLKWMNYTARAQGKTNCIICAAGRPSLTTAPARITPHNSPQGFVCLLELFMDGHIPGCSIAIKSRLNNMYPQTPIRSIPPRFEVNLTPDYHLRLLMPVTLFTRGSPGPDNQTTSRHRRDTALTDHFDLTKNTPTYMDSIGIPRGVPNQFKLADQIAAGFENMPLISAIIPITPNKNVDRINYIHYNVQRLSNLTRDAVEGLASQLAATSLMAYQNRLALDMLLAEKGGVCSMFGAQCCTFIPNNTAPDGSVTRALAGLRALSVQMAEDSGVDNPMEKWMTDMFGKWKGLLMAVLSSLACFVGIVVCCGCCCIPCARTLCSRLITTALEKEKQQPPPYSEIPGALIARLSDEVLSAVE
uniref:Envelope protein n=1 Tax=Gadus morhua TaxID=8049 RepID=A0A8C5AIW1_GADMO